LLQVFGDRVTDWISDGQKSEVRLWRGEF